jgi:hypothetical protein
MTKIFLLKLGVGIGLECKYFSVVKILALYDFIIYSYMYLNSHLPKTNWL